MLNLEDLLKYTEQVSASDLHLKVGNVPMVRIFGELKPMNGAERLTKDIIERFTNQLLTEHQRKEFEKYASVDFVFTVDGVGRFRGHIFKQRENINIAIRRISLNIPTFEQLGLPAVCRQLCSKSRGLVLVTGGAGCGKTTTLASMVDYINSNFPVHIVTIEDPIEYTHESKVGLVDQRGVGVDTHSFSQALRHVFRQDPDVILIGEMRDLETIQLAIVASETGHLVLGTLHTLDAIQSIHRIIDVFPLHQQPQIRMELVANLEGVISQTLCKRADGKGQVAAFEILVATPAVRNLIKDMKLHQLRAVIETSRKFGMISLDQSLAELVKKGLITIEEAKLKALNPKDVERFLGES